MRRIVFSLDSGYVVAKRQDIFDFPDDTTDTEINEAFTDWISQYGSWWDVADVGEEE